MLSAGEASGDLSGAHLAQALRRLQPGLRLFGMGGARMKAAGVRLLFNPTELSTIGFLEVVRNYTLLRRLLTRLSEVAAHQRPDALVVIDYPGFNLPLAELVRKQGIPVVFYFSPGAWAWGAGRAARVAAMGAWVAAVFPFEAEFYRQAGAKVEFVGHPLPAMVKPRWSGAEARRRLGFREDAPLFVLMPGSRQQEIRLLLPPLLAAAAGLGSAIPGLQWGLPLAVTIPRDRVEEHLARYPQVPVRIVEDATYELLAAADLGLICSGTATLEAACLGVPMLIVYRTSLSTYWLSRLLLHLPYVGLPNIAAGRQIVPELLQDACTPQRIAAQALALWQDQSRRAQMRAALLETVSRLQGEGAVERAAGLILKVAREKL
ncbi:MAG: lipid-A-disaccharide synthase [Firmicutes bacterium]|nr:lipid-A-disaccharide synthase [Bacillota bacterium]